MTNQSQLLMRSITGPIMLITIGSLFLVDKFTQYSFWQTSPALLIVLGVLKLLGGRAAKAQYYPPPPPPPSGAGGTGVAS